MSDRIQDLIDKNEKIKELKETLDKAKEDLEKDRDEIKDALGIKRYIIFPSKINLSSFCENWILFGIVSLIFILLQLTIFPLMAVIFGLIVLLSVGGIAYYLWLNNGYSLHYCPNTEDGPKASWCRACQKYSS